LFYLLQKIFSGPELFRYITFRGIAAALTAFLVSIIFGPMIIRWLKRMNFKEVASGTSSEFVDNWQEKKAGTPTMGGILIILSILAGCLLWTDLSRPSVLLMLGTVLMFGMLGFLDDYLPLVRSDKKSFRIRTKLLLQFVIALSLAGVLTYLLWQKQGGIGIEGRGGARSGSGLHIYFPFFKTWSLRLGITLMVIWVAFVVVGSANAVNLTDGLDGLAAGCAAIAASAFSVLSYVVGRHDFAAYLGLPYVSYGGEVAIFCAAVFGACIGFLWFNCHPAEVFMGDTGSLALGGGIAVAALAIIMELLLILIGFVFVIEALSVLLQVGSFKATGKRIFPCAPIHISFQMKGWKETKVTTRFWILAGIMAMLGLLTLKIR
jgi:phospho-N-acetylmuramoyl-pentapeptide-transferase